MDQQPVRVTQRSFAGTSKAAPQLTESFSPWSSGTTLAREWWPERPAGCSEPCLCWAVRPKRTWLNSPSKWCGEQPGTRPIHERGSGAPRRRVGSSCPSPALGSPLQGSVSCSCFLSSTNPAPHPSQRSSLWEPSADIVPGEFVFGLEDPTTLEVEFSLQRSRQVGDGDTRSVSERDLANPRARSWGRTALPVALSLTRETWELKDKDHTLLSPLATSQHGRRVPRGQHGACCTRSNTDEERK